MTMRKAIEAALRRAHAAANKTGAPAVSRRTQAASKPVSATKPASRPEPSAKTKAAPTAEEAKPMPTLSSKLRKLGIY